MSGDGYDSIAADEVAGDELAERRAAIALEDGDCPDCGPVIVPTAADRAELRAAMEQLVSALTAAVRLGESRGMTKREVMGIYLDLVMSS